MQVLRSTIRAAILAAAAGLTLSAMPWAGAQQAAPPAPAPPAAGEPAPAPSEPNKAPEQPSVSVSARDSDVRQVLEDLFRQARITNYAISHDVAGTVSLTVQNKPFEEVLMLISRVASTPLTWSKTDGIYLVRPRPVRRTTEMAAPAAPEAPVVAAVDSGGVRYETIKLMYADPRAIVDLFEALRPDNLTAAVAVEATNDVLTRWGPEGSVDFVKATLPVEWSRMGQNGSTGASASGVSGMGNSQSGLSGIGNSGGVTSRGR